MKAGALAAAWAALLAGCGSDSDRAARCMTDPSLDDRALDSCTAVLLPQLDARAGGPDYLVCTSGMAISSSGVIVGETCDDQGFIWSSAEPEGSLLRPSFPVEADGVQPVGINRAGDVVGFFSPAENPFLVAYPFVLSTGGLTVLPRLEEEHLGVALAISDDGTIVGWSDTSSGPVAVYWEDGDLHRIAAVDEIGGSYAIATAISPGGAIAGVSNTPDIQFIQAFRWLRPGPVELLPTLFEGDVGHPHDINDGGVMVGRAGAPDRTNRPVYWDEDGDVHELPRLHDTPEAAALAVNDRGVMVGYEMTPEFVATEARLWLDGEVHHLADLVPGLPAGYELIRATDINDDGLVVAHASVEDGGPVRHVTLLIRPDLDP